jgi:hypothetical protein
VFGIGEEELAVDVDLSDAKHRNVATAYRDVRFLDTFFTRIRRNEYLIATAVPSGSGRT